MKKMRALKMAVGLCLILMAALIVSAPAFAKQVTITISDHNPEPSSPSQALKYWAEKVNEIGAGKVEVVVHYGGALLAEKEAYRGVQGGVVDAAHYPLDRRDGFLLNTVITLPFMGYPAQPKTGEIYAKLREKFPEMMGEFKGVIPYVFCMMPGTHIHTKSKPVRTPAELKGLKMHGAEYVKLQVLNAAGATPVQLDVADMYMGLDRGVIDGVLNHFPVCLIFRILPLLKYHTVFGAGGIEMIPIGVVWNEKKWNSYPADVQKILTDSVHFYIERFYVEDAKVQVAAANFCKENNHTVINLTDKEIKEWYDLVKKPVHDKWIEEAEANGLPGKAVYKEALKLIKEYSKK